MRIRTLSLCALTAAAAVVVAAGAALVCTQAGLRAAFSAAAGLVSGFSYEQVEGTLFHARVKGLSYGSSGVTVKADELSWQLYPQELWQRKIHVAALDVKKLQVTVDSSQMPPAAPSSPFVWGMGSWEALAEKISLTDASVNADGTTIAVGSFHSALVANTAHVSLIAPRLQGFSLTPAATTAAASAAPTSNWVTQLKEMGQKPLLTALPHWSSPVPVAIEDFSAQAIFLPAQGIQNAQLAFTGQVDASRIQLTTLQLQAPAIGTAALSGSVELSAAVPVQMSLSVQPDAALAVPVTSAQVQVQGAVGDKLSLTAATQGDAQVTVQGQVELTQKASPFALTVQSPLMGWMDESGTLVSAQNVELSVNGNLAQAQAAAKAAVFAPGLANAAFTLQAGLQPEKATYDARLAQAAGGRLALQGDVTWVKKIEAAAQLSLSQWDLYSLAGIAQHTGIDGRLNLAASSDGAQWEAKLSDLALSGQVGRNKLQVHGSAHYDAQGKFAVQDLVALIGLNRLQLSAQGSAHNFEASLVAQAPNLHQVDLRLAGQFTADIKARGSFQAPQLEGHIQGKNFGAFGVAASQLELVADARGGEKTTGQVHLSARQASLQGVEFSQINAELTGTEAHQQARLSWRSQPASGEVVLLGAFNGKDLWTGSLESAKLETITGPWSLRSPVHLSYGLTKKEFKIASHCWVNPDAEFCLAQDAVLGEKGSALVEIRRLSLGLLRHWLPGEVKAQGDITGNLKATWDQAAKLPVRGELTLGGSHLLFTRQVDKQDVTLTIETLALQLGADANAARLSWQLRLDDGGGTQGDVLITDPVKKQLLSGTVAFNDLHLARLNVLLSQGENVQGTALGSLQLSGSLAAPRVNGTLQARDLLFLSSRMPFVMKPSTLQIDLHGQSSELTGQINAEKGSLALKGSAQWLDAQSWTATVQAQSKEFAIYVRPYVHAVIAPDITAQASSAGLNVTGEVFIAQALARVNDLPDSATAVSSDEVMLDAAYRPLQKAQPPLPISLNIAVKLGDRVDVRAFGLRARLTGAVRITQDEKGMGSSGKIELKDGRFTSYGQDLEVRKGEFSFAGAPSDPIISVEAIRNPESTEDGVTAGVRVTGRASRPKVDIFSDPAQPQQTALSYLLTGSAGNTQGKDQNAAMTSMLIGLGASSAGRMIGALGNSLGIEDLSVGTEGTGTDSEVVVSGYILPGLQVKYGVGIFDSLATITLRYRLLPQFYVEVATGMEQAVSVLYEFDF